MAKLPDQKDISPEKALLANLAGLMTEERLIWVAGCDYGQDKDEHLAALREICETLQVPEILEWVPREVLELTRWSRPERWYAEENVDLRSVYETRAYCCAVLMQAGGECQSWFSVSETLGNLMESLIRYRPEWLHLVPGHLSVFKALAPEDFHEAEHAFRLAAELCVWLELEDGDAVAETLAALLDMEALARLNTPMRAKDYGRVTAFAGQRSMIAAEGWHCVGKLIADRAMIITEEEPRALVAEFGRQLQAIKSQSE